jgi:acyl-CoA dehydrogenase
VDSSFVDENWQMTTDSAIRDETRAMFRETASRVFSEHASRDVINDIERGHWPIDLWRNVEEAGLSWAAVPENVGGAGGSIGDLAIVLREAGRYAVPLPLAETALGAMIIAEAGLTPPSGPLALAIADESSSLLVSGRNVSGQSRRVAFSPVADHILVVASGEQGGTLAIVPRSAASIEIKSNHAGEPCGDLTFKEATASAVVDTVATPSRVRALAALARVNQMSGAADRVLTIVTQYANERVQFGRTIGSFQAVRQMLAELSTYVAAIAAAASSATRDTEDGDGLLGIMAAKTQASQTAHRICAIAHQSMGAMGFTHEHVLHHYTRRLWVWRRDYGSEIDWGAQLGRAVAGAGSDALWASLAAGRITTKWP